MLLYYYHLKQGEYALVFGTYSPTTINWREYRLYHNESVWLVPGTYKGNE